MTHLPKRADCDVCMAAKMMRYPHKKVDPEERTKDLSYGDLTTLPEAETSDLRSLTSGKVLGRVKITPEKGAHARSSAARTACTTRAPRAAPSAHLRICAICAAGAHLQHAGPPAPFRSLLLR